MILGWIKAIWRWRYGSQLAASSGFGSRLPGGRHLTILAMYTCSRLRPTASSMLLSSLPARHTKGSPWRSSSAPGASPMTIHCALRSPTPNTACVRPWHNAQRVQLSTRSRSGVQSSSPISASLTRGDGSNVSRPGASGRATLLGDDGAIRSSQPWTPMACRYWRRVASSWVMVPSELLLGPLHRFHLFIEGIDVGLGRGDDDVGVGALAVDDSAALLHSHRHFALRISAAGDGIDRIELQVGAAPHNRFEGLDHGIHRPVALSLHSRFRAVQPQAHLGLGRLAGFRADP